MNKEFENLWPSFKNNEQTTGLPVSNDSLSPLNTNQELEKQLSQFADRVQKLEQEINNASSETRDLDEKLKTQKDEYNAFKQKIIEGLGLFVAFITFVSANVTVFSRVEHVSIAILFMGLMLLCMLTFLYAFFIILEPRSTNLKNRMQKLIYCTGGVVIVIFLCLWGMEKKLITVVRFLGQNKPICIHCTIDKDSELKKITPILRAN